MEQPVTMSSGTASSAPGTTGTRQAKPVYDLVEENVPLESAPAASSADSSSDLFIIE